MEVFEQIYDLDVLFVFLIWIISHWEVLYTYHRGTTFESWHRVKICHFVLLSDIKGQLGSSYHLWIKLIPCLCTYHLYYMIPLKLFISYNFMNMYKFFKIKRFDWNQRFLFKSKLVTSGMTQLTMQTELSTC